MKIPKNKVQIIEKAYQAGKIKEYGHNAFSVPSRFFVLGITPRMVTKVIGNIKERG